MITGKEDVMQALREAGVPGVTVIEVKCTGADAAPDETSYSIEYGEEVCYITKIEVVCRDEDAVRLADAIRKSAYTGHRGDGAIFVSNVEHAVKIRTGEWGDNALLPAGE